MNNIFGKSGDGLSTNNVNYRLKFSSYLPPGRSSFGKEYEIGRFF